VRLEGLGQLKNPMTSSGFESATFQLVVPQQTMLLRALKNNKNKIIIIIISGYILLTIGYRYITLLDLIHSAENICKPITKRER
jgi:hypothetical protein